MKRLLLDSLITWKQQSERKPVLLDGARQTGKSFLLERLFGAHFEQVIRLDFLEQPILASLFEESLNPQNIIDNIAKKLLDFIDEIEKILGKKAIRNYMPLQKGDVPATWADCSLLQQLTGYAPNTSINHGVKKFIDWYKSYYKVEIKY